MHAGLAVAICALCAARSHAQTTTPQRADSAAIDPATPVAKPAPADAPGAEPPKQKSSARPKKKTPKSAAKPAPKAAAPAPTTQAASAEQVAAERAALEKEKTDVQQLRTTTLKLIKAMVARGLLPREEAEQLVSEADRGAIVPDRPIAPLPAQIAARPANAPAQAEPSVENDDPESEQNAVRVPYVPELVRNQIRDQIREEVVAQAKAERWALPNTLPQWLDRISLEGDLMLRYEGDRYGPGNTPALTYNAITGSDVSNTTQNTDRLRYRARIGLLARITQTWTGGIGLASGDTNTPLATLQTLGTYAERGPISIDRAYLKWEPNERWTLSGGRMANPYFHTDLTWDPDLGFEGAYGTYRPRFTERVSGFFTAGGYIVQYQSPTPETPDPKNKFLIGLQAGANWDIDKDLKLLAALSYYGYRNISGIPNTTLNSHANDWTAPAFKQKGNTLFNIDNDADPTTNLYALASKFQILSLAGKLDLLQFDPFNIRLTGEFAKNIGFDQSEILQRTGLYVEPATTAWRAGFAFGKLEVKEWKDWQVFADYRRIGADSLLDAFVDSEFYLGGTNTRGYSIGGMLGLDHNVWVRLRWMSADEVRGPPLAIDVLQLDLNARF